MNSKEFRKAFERVAKSYGFQSAFGCCYKTSPECIFVLELQKSYFGDYYLLNVKTFIQGCFGQKHVIAKDCIKKYMGDVFNRQPPQYFPIFNFDIDIPDEKRMEMLTEFFDDFVVPYSEKNLTISGIRELGKKGKLLLLDSVEKELNRLYPE